MNEYFVSENCKNYPRIFVGVNKNKITVRTNTYSNEGIYLRRYKLIFYANYFHIVVTAYNIPEK